MFSVSFCRQRACPTGKLWSQNLQNLFPTTQRSCQEKVCNFLSYAVFRNRNDHCPSSTFSRHSFSFLLFLLSQIQLVSRLCLVKVFFEVEVI